MQDDGRAINELIVAWHQKSREGDVDGVLALMTDDVVFSVVGRPPFGKQEFADSSRQMQGVKLEVVAHVLEVEVHGDCAWSRVRLQVAMTMKDGKRSEREGYAMSIYRKQSDGRWLLARDANLLGPPQAK